MPTVITSSCSLDEMEGRLASRLVDPKISIVLAILAPDYRIKTATKEEEAKHPRQKPRKWR
jgi:hypothetical protein